MAEHQCSACLNHPYQKSTAEYSTLIQAGVSSYSDNSFSSPTTITIIALFFITLFSPHKESVVMKTLPLIYQLPLFIKQFGEIESDKPTLLPMHILSLEKMLLLSFSKGLPTYLSLLILMLRRGTRHSISIYQLPLMIKQSREVESDNPALLPT